MIKITTKKANTDIKVFKILEEFHGRHVGPWHRLYTYERGSNVPEEPEYYSYLTGRGWLSVFDNEERAKSLKEILEKDFPENKYTILEMKIPKGTEYIHHITAHEYKAKELIW